MTTMNPKKELFSTNDKQPTTIQSTDKNSDIPIHSIHWKSLHNVWVYENNSFWMKFNEMNEKRLKLFSNGHKNGLQCNSMEKKKQAWNIKIHDIMKYEIKSKHFSLEAEITSWNYFNHEPAIYYNVYIYVYTAIHGFPLHYAVSRQSIFFSLFRFVLLVFCLLAAAGLHFSFSFWSGVSNMCIFIQWFVFLLLVSCRDIGWSNGTTHYTSHYRHAHIESNRRRIIKPTVCVPPKNYMKVLRAMSIHIFISILSLLHYLFCFLSIHAISI